MLLESAKHDAKTMSMPSNSLVSNRDNQIWASTIVFTRINFATNKVSN